MTNNNNTQPERVSVSIKGAEFGEFVESMDRVLNVTLLNMVKTGDTQGEISCKLKISLRPSPSYDEESDMKTYTHLYEHSVSATIKRQCKLSGEIEGEYELVQGEDGFPILCPTKEKQSSLYD